MTMTNMGIAAMETRRPAPTNREEGRPSYVLITPARNEEELLGQTIQSVLKQTIRPVKWVIVSDGSTDGTEELVRRWAREHDWIELVILPQREERHFAGKVRAFNAGYERVRNLDYAVIGNLDADVTFEEEDHFEFMLGEFARNPRLGVAGSGYREGEVVYPYRFTSLEDVAGACQLFRRRCFEEIGGYPELKSGGIDVIAVFSAQTKGWQTRTFPQKMFRHHRKVGSAQHENVYAKLLHEGSKDYILGSHPGWEVLRSVYQVKNRPYVIGGMLLLAGYMRAMLSGTERTIPEELMEIRRKEQMQRLRKIVRETLG
jgi:poly-beta-1,6-N-acetyl-D-glucosamine synthase